MRSFLTFAALAGSEAAYGQTMRLCPVAGPGCDFTTFAAAVAGIPAGGTIEIESGTYVSADVNITKSLFIRPRPSAVVTLNDAANDVLDVSGVGVVVDVAGINLDADGNNMQCLWLHGSGSVVADGITCLPHAQTSQPGGIIIEPGSVATIRNSTFDNVDSTATGVDQAGTIAVRGGDLTLQNVTISNSSGGYGGAVIVTGGVASFEGVTFTNNTGPAGGAVRVTGGTVDIKSGTFTGNVATGALGTDGGGALHVAAGTVSIGGATFTSNTAVRGGAVFFTNNTPLTVTGATFTQNSATGGDGGAIASLEAGAVTIDGATFARNTALTTSGAVGLNNVDSLAFYRSWLCDNSAAQGGGLHVAGTAGPVTIANNVFLENLSTGVGSALRYNPTTTATIRNNAFLGNSTAAGQGALYFVNGVWSLSSNLIAQTAAGDGVRRASATGTPTFANNDLFANSSVDFNVGGVTTALPATNLTTDPQLFAYVRGTAGDAVGCGTPDLRSRYNSGLRNAGEPFTVDLDTTRADIGPYGGPTAPASAWVDLDSDGFPWVYDCDDAKAAVNPSAIDVCNGTDDDCDGTLDENPDLTWYADTDKDTYGAGLGYMSCSALGKTDVNVTGDCDPITSTTYPGAPEVCDGKDQDCDTVPDDNAIDASTWHPDVDADTFGTATSSTKACAAPVGFVADATDCRDNDKTAYPGAPETCDDVDDDCDTFVDDNPTDPTPWYADTDTDGFGNKASFVASCDPVTGHVLDKTDCDDTRNAAHPGAPELCNTRDDDCDGSIDESATDAATFHLDGDNDSYGSPLPSDQTKACAAPAGYVADATDCDDTNTQTHPNAPEQCNDVDDDCDGAKDDNVSTTDWYPDLDQDGFGDRDGAPVNLCAAPPESVDNAEDCDDTDEAVNPAAEEVCNGVDDDCDGGVDVGTLENVTWYQDTDGDGFGDDATGKLACAAPDTDYVLLGGDCDDDDDQIHPGAEEYCDDLDSDCDTFFDDAATRHVFFDEDGDGFGDDATEHDTCEMPPDDVREVSIGGDCDDTDPDRNPDGESCDTDTDDTDGRPYVESTDTGLIDVPGEACGCRATGVSPSLLLFLTALLLRRRQKS